MKHHATKEQCFENSGLPEAMRPAFYTGWIASATQINEGMDADWISEELAACGFFGDEAQEEFKAKERALEEAAAKKKQRKIRRLKAQLKELEE